MVVAMKSVGMTRTMGLSGSRLAQRASRISSRTSIIRRFREGDNQAQKESQGANAPKNPITGEPLQQVNKQSESYQSQIFTNQGDNTKARIISQLDAQPSGREFGELQAFDGLGPEVINSRLAMLGFAVALFFELTTGKDVVEQARSFPLLTVATFVIFTVASWIPFQAGQSYNVKSGPFTPALEVATGRIAMVGFSGLLLTELYLQHPVFPQIFGF
jgi:hypothetical protein